MCDTPIISTDYYATMLQMAGLPLRPKQHLDGVSLVRLLNGEKLADRTFFWHYPHYGNQGGSPAGAIRRGNYKLIEWYEDRRVELYDLKDDPGELQDLSAKKADQTEILRLALHAWRDEVKAVMPTPNPSSNDPDPARGPTLKVSPARQPARSVTKAAGSAGCSSVSRSRYVNGGTSEEERHRRESSMGRKDQDSRLPRCTQSGRAAEDARMRPA